jgi:RNA polymerase-interacting CarD/CdnL/TRCF family regulator
MRIYNKKSILGTRHLRVTGKKCGYFIVTFSRSDPSLSVGEKTINVSEVARICTRHLRVTGKKYRYFIVTFSRSDLSLSKGEESN